MPAAPGSNGEIGGLDGQGGHTDEQDRLAAVAIEGAVLGVRDIKLV
jgi:hypothetical protein